MSFLSWFAKKTPTPESGPSLSSDLGQADATLPIHRSLQPPPARGADNSSRKFERLERRELLYSVVRECMNSAGVLSSSYKFKVLSLDAGGRKYLIMMDMPREQMADPSRFAEIEGVIARSAKERHDILVTAVYWRVNELVSAGQRAQATAPAEPLPDKSPVAAPATYAPLQDEEVLAFKRAVAAAASGAAAARRGEVVHSGPRNPKAEQDFSNTEPFEAPPNLGPSQFGGLS